jgi:hypothetical protein
VSERQRTRYELEEQLSQSTQCWQPTSPRLPRQWELSVHIEQRTQKCERISRSESLQNVDQLQPVQRSHSTQPSLPRSRPRPPASSRNRDSKTLAVSSSFIGAHPVVKRGEKHIRSGFRATGPLWLGALLCSACGSGSAPPPAMPASAWGESKPAPAALRDADWGVFGSRRFSLAVAVPMRREWQKSETRNWLLLRHAASESELLVRTWRTTRSAGASGCESEARTTLPALPVLDETNAVEDARVEAPPGFDGRLGVAVEAHGRRIRGYVLLFGADVGRCFAGVFTTHADSELEISERLELVAHGVFSRVRVAGVEDRVPAR